MTVGITELPPEGMQLGGVALAGDADRGTKTTEGLSLLFTTAGITVQGPQPQIERLLVWSGLDTATCREKIALADGRTAAVMELTSGGQSIRFLLPTDTVTPGQAAYLDQALPAWLARYKGTPVPAAAPPPPPPPSAAPAGPPPTQYDPGTFQPATPAAATAGAAAATALTAATVAGAGAPPPPPPVAAPSPAPPVAPPPPVTGSAAPPPAAPPPPPPAAPAPAPAPADWSAAPAAAVAAGTGGWEPTAAAPPAPANGWDDPPLGQVAAADVLPPPKKTRGWRKQADAPAPTGPAAGPGLLPPPPVGYGAPEGGVPAAATSGTPPVDPVTGQPRWGEPAFADGLVTPEEPTKKSRGWRKSSKATAGAVAAGTAGAATAGPGDLLSPPGTQDGGLFGSPADPFAATPPGTGLPPSAETAPPPAKKSRTTLLLVVLLAVVVVAGAVFLIKRHNDSTTTTTAPPVTVPSGTAADIALAGSINLRLTDLPAGWARSPATTQSTVPPAAPAAAETQAEQSLASCIAQPVTVVDGLFGTGALAGQAAAVKSPTFQSVAATGIQMSSTTAVLGTAAEATPLAAAFTNANFATCYATFQSTVIGAAVPGATAQVQTVTLTAPAGVSSYGYLTTFTIPNQGTEVLGQAFIVGGRIVAKLTPTTNGPAVPTSAFSPAYTAMVDRVAQAANR